MRMPLPPRQAPALRAPFGSGQSDCPPITVSARTARRRRSTAHWLGCLGADRRPDRRDRRQLHFSIPAAPGRLSANQSGPVGTVSASLRSFDQNYVRVMVDGIGISIRPAPRSPASLSAFPTGGVGRVEVLKGSQSASGRRAVAA